jgi:hypothetical protein
MNFSVVLGQLCIDPRFRERFFRDRGKNAKAALASLSLPFTRAERELLLRLSKKGGNSPGLNQDFQQLNGNLRTAAGCGRGPCPFDNFALIPPR